MNSLPNYNYKDDCDPCKKEKKEKKVCPTIIKCGCPNSTAIPIIAAPGSTFTLATLALDTSCLKDPCIKLEFATNLVTIAGATGTFSIQVFKQCNNQLTALPVGPAWTMTLAATLGETFSFFVCDCDCSCFNDCCLYTVVATNTTAIAVGASLNNATLGAIATCSNSCC